MVASKPKLTVIFAILLCFSDPSSGSPRRSTMRSLLKCAVLAGAALLASCASTSFVSTWKAPDAQSLRNEGSKVVTVVMAKNESTRLAAEESLAREITKRGGQGIPAYTLIQNEPTQDEATAKDALERAGISIIVVMRPTNVKQEISSTPSATPMYWGGYYGYGWGGAYGTEIRTDTILYVETLVYSMKQDKLVWSGESGREGSSLIYLVMSYAVL